MDKEQIQTNIQEESKKEEDNIQTKQPEINQNYQQRFEACMLLACVGDALGYKNGSWEFNTSVKIIHQEFNTLTENKGMQNLKLDMRWRYSDDTVMHIATAKALANSKAHKFDFEQTMVEMAKEYKICWRLMAGRAPGKMCGKQIGVLKHNGSNWNKIPFQDRAGGCGGSMRAACIGLCFKYPEELDMLLKVSIESGRLTHHHPTGYFGAMTASLFTALALQNIEITKWPAILVSIAIPESKKYVKNCGREVKLNLSNMDYFINAWKNYIKLRGLSEDPEVSDVKPVFPEDYNKILVREKFIKSVSFSGWGGSSGHDSVLIAYDALLSSNQDWNELCKRSALHGGDNDSTGTIAGAWYGALKGLDGVFEKNYKYIEDTKKLKQLGQTLFNLYFNKYKKDQKDEIQKQGEENEKEEQKEEGKKQDEKIEQNQ